MDAREQLLNKNLVRKLGPTEILITRAIQIRAFINTRAFLLSSKFNLYSNIELLNKAINLWKEAYHFLRYQIKMNDNNEGHFVYAPDDILNSFNNVFYLKFEATNIQKLSKRIWKIFQERELLFPIDSNDLLWRLFFIQIQNDHDHNFQYYVIFSGNYASYDGRNIGFVLSHLLQFIEDVFLNKEVIIKPYDVVMGLSEHPNVVEYENKKSTKATNYPENPLHEFIKVPNELKPEQSPENKFYEECDGKFVTLDNKIYATYNDILKQSEESYTKLRCAVVNSDIVSKLLLKCKKNNLKLNGCLTIVSVIATQQTIKFFTNNNVDCLNRTYFGAMVNLRSHLKSNIGGFFMVHPIVSFPCEHDYIDINADNFWSHMFWKYAKDAHDSLHERIDRQEYLDLILEDKEFVENFKFEDNQTDKLKFHFLFSNRGDMNKICKSRMNMLCYKETYGTMGFDKYNSIFIFHPLIETINGCLFWSFVYSKYVVKEEAAQFYENYVNEAINKLVNYE